ncbi:MAG: carbamoyltransferase HypF [Calditrichota bacterium]
MHTMDQTRIQHLEIRVSGTVQGVGFRPFIYRLAREHRLLGSVLNNSQGVIIRVQGEESVVAAFTRDIRKQAPPAARVMNLDCQALPLDHYTEFRILPSETLDETFTQVPPDLALCEACRRELLDSRNRRHGYPFINCIHCGPRFTIIHELPYDRPFTTMSGFTMCAACQAEYDDPADRRFHTQPNACHDCGPQLEFLRYAVGGWNTVNDGDPLRSAVEALRSRRIILVQGLGGFHLACDAADDALVSELRRRKHRDEKPFAVMFPDEASLRESCESSPSEWNLISSVRAPIVLLRKHSDSIIAASVAPHNPFVGAMLPYTPLHVLLLREYGQPLIMTSANLSDEPICFEVPDALSRMQGIADAALVHNRPIHIFADDSVVKVVGDVPRIWRRARGYVPQAVHVPDSFRVPTLAFGPQLKNTFCLGKRQFALLSQHCGDMENEAAVDAQHRAMDHFLHLFDAKIELIACDLHPDYSTTRLAEAWSAEHNVPLVRVQHHHAHLAACLAENETSEPAIGLSLDGTGYGTDGTIWGGEILIGDFRTFDRVGYLQTVAMPGGEKAAQESWRMALSWLHESFGDSLYELPLPFITELQTHYDRNALNLLTGSNLRQHVFPLTSSLGRLFDAVAALLFFGTRRQYEGQAAMLLEGMISPVPAAPYPMDVVEHDGLWMLSPLTMFREMADDIRKGMDAAIMARRFHEAVVEGFVRVCERVRDESNLNRVALSGGCFQNEFLHIEMEARLRYRGFEVLTHRQVPAGDGGVSLGQAVIANATNEVN